MAKNKIQDGKLINLPVISGTLSGMGAVVGSYLHGVAQNDRDASGNAVLDCGPAVYDLPVYPYDGSSPSAVAVGDALYWDTGLTPDNLDKNSAGIYFGYALEAIAASPLALSTIKVMVMHVQLTAGSIALSALGAGITPSHVVKYAGLTTAVPASPSPVATIVVSAGMTGILDTDIVEASFKVNGSTVKSIASIVIVTGTSITFTATGSGFVAGDVIQYVVYRAAV